MSWYFFFIKCKSDQNMNMSILITSEKTEVTPLLMHLSYYNLVQGHIYLLHKNLCITYNIISIIIYQLKKCTYKASIKQIFVHIDYVLIFDEVKLILLMWNHHWTNDYLTFISIRTHPVKCQPVCWGLNIKETYPSRSMWVVRVCSPPIHKSTQQLSISPEHTCNRNMEIIMRVTSQALALLTSLYDYCWKRMHQGLSAKLRHCSFAPIPWKVVLLLECLPH